jgi:hypothetical protein
MNLEPVARITFAYAGLLIALGVLGYFFTGRQSITALIPSFFGIVVLIAMMVLRSLASPPILKWVMIGLAVIGLLATMGGIPKVVTMLTGGAVARPAAAVSQAIMAVLSFVYGVIVLRIK